MSPCCQPQPSNTSLVIAAAALSLTGVDQAKGFLMLALKISNKAYTQFCTRTIVPVDQVSDSHYSLLDLHKIACNTLFTLSWSVFNLELSMALVHTTASDTSLIVQVPNNKLKQVHKKLLII